MPGRCGHGRSGESTGSAQDEEPSRALVEDLVDLRSSTRQALSVPAATVDRMALSEPEREQFLAEPHIGALSVVERADRGPLTVPIWYHYTPGGELWIRTGTDSRKARAIRAAGRFSLLAERTAPTVRYVSVEGPVSSTVPDSREQAREMAARYLPEDEVADFVEYERTQLGEHIIICMQPQRWVSADLGAV